MRSNTICRNYLYHNCSSGKRCPRIHPVDRDFYFQEHLRRQADNSPVGVESDSVSEYGHTIGCVGASSGGPTVPKVKLPSSESRGAPDWDSNTGQWVSGLNNTVWNDSSNSSDEGGADSSVNLFFRFVSASWSYPSLIVLFVFSYWFLHSATCWR